MESERPAAPRISVVMVTYNHAPFIAEAIDSVLDQGIEDLELCVVDDGSTDHTAEVLVGYGPRIRLASQPNAGEAAARNRGLALARGDYLLFLDSDDKLLPGSLEALAAALDRSPDIGVVYSDGLYCDEAWRPIARLSDRRPANPEGDVLAAMVQASFVGALHCAMMRASVIETEGLRFDERIVIGPDWDFWIQLAECARFGYLAEDTCLYRIHGANLTSTTDARQRSESLMRVRLNTLRRPAFGRLPEAVRERLFQALLLEGAPERWTVRRRIVQSEAFLGLAPRSRARLLRQVAAQAILERDRSMALEWLAAMRRTGATDLRGWLLSVLARLPIRWSTRLLAGMRQRFARRRSPETDRVAMAFGLGRPGEGGS